MLDLEDRGTPVREPARSGPSEVQVGVAGACIVFVAAKVPETRGRSLESIERALKRGGSFRKPLELS